MRSLTRIAQFLKWGEFIVAFILMAFVTSVPELFVGIMSAFHHKPELSFGNVIGSNIVNLTLAVGICVLIAGGLKVKAVILQRSSIYTAIIALLPIVLILDGRVSRIDGIILLLAFMFYFHRLISQEERFTKVLANSFKRDSSRFRLFLRDLGMFLLGVVLLLLSAEGIVWSASFLAKVVGLPLVVIGALVVALGTNLPEITFGIKAISMGHKDMVLGSLMGSVVVNSTLVLGLTVLISPLEIFKFSPYITGIIFTVLTCLFFSIFARTKKDISKKEGIFLIFVYLMFLLIVFWFR